MDGGFNQMINIREKTRKEKDEDFMEEDVWVANFNKEREGSSASSALACRIPAAPRVIPRVNSGSQHHQLSAPVNIPDWSKIHSKKSNRGGSESDAWAAAGDGNGGNKLYYDDAEKDDDDEDSDEMVPPHEFIARRLARSPVVSYSMCEGVGRTLKGRDLSQLRNAILTKTGFLE